MFVCCTALLYSGTSWILNYTETPSPIAGVDTDLMRSATAGALAGAFYRLPMGPGPSLVFSVFGATTMGAATWAKQKFHPQPFNLSIKDFLDSFKSRPKFGHSDEL